MKEPRALNVQRILREVIGAEVLGEAEENCDQHVHVMIVRYTCDPAAKGHRTETIAALLRVLAIYEDGYCAVRDAEDDDLKPPSAMRFRFTSLAKRQAFHAAAKLYLNSNLFGCLSFKVPSTAKPAARPAR